jgi:hypothetical protein
MVASASVLYCNWLMDKHSFDEVYPLMNKLSAKESALTGLLRNFMDCDRIYCELLGENSDEKLSTLLVKQQKQFMRSMKNYPVVLRTQYAYALLAERNKEEAEKIMEAFEKCALSYPYESDIEAERELMSIAEQRFSASDNEDGR